MCELAPVCARLQWVKGYLQNCVRLSKKSTWGWGQRLECAGALYFFPPPPPGSSCSWMAYLWRKRAGAGYQNQDREVLFVYGSCICDLLMVGVNVYPVCKMALLSDIFKVSLLFTFRFKCHICKEVFPDHTSSLTLHVSLM